MRLRIEGGQNGPGDYRVVNAETGEELKDVTSARFEITPMGATATITLCDVEVAFDVADGEAEFRRGRLWHRGHMEHAEAAGITGPKPDEPNETEELAAAFGVKLWPDGALAIDVKEPTEDELAEFVAAHPELEESARRMAAVFVDFGKLVGETLREREPVPWAASAAKTAGLLKQLQAIETSTDVRRDAPGDYRPITLAGRPGLDRRRTGHEQEANRQDDTDGAHETILRQWEPTDGVTCLGNMYLEFRGEAGGELIYTDASFVPSRVRLIHRVHPDYGPQLFWRYWPYDEATGLYGATETLPAILKDQPPRRGLLRRPPDELLYEVEIEQTGQVEYIIRDGYVSAQARATFVPGKVELIKPGDGGPIYWQHTHQSGGVSRMKASFSAPGWSGKMTHGLELKNHLVKVEGTGRSYAVALPANSAPLWVETDERTYDCAQLDATVVMRGHGTEWWALVGGSYLVGLDGEAVPFATREEAQACVEKLKMAQA